jgi:hypothetical protein
MGWQIGAGIEMRRDEMRWDGMMEEDTRAGRQAGRQAGSRLGSRAAIS